MKEIKNKITLRQISEHLAGRDSDGHLRMTEQTISRILINCGIDKDAATLDEIRHSIFIRSRKQSERGVSRDYVDDGEPEDESYRAKRLNNKLAVEKIRLTASQADDSELKVSLKKRDVAPLAAMELAISKVAVNAASKLEQIPIQIKRKIPKLTAKDLEAITSLIVVVQNDVADIEISDDDIKQGLEIMMNQA